MGLLMSYDLLDKELKKEVERLNLNPLDEDDVVAFAKQLVEVELYTVAEAINESYDRYLDSMNLEF